MLWSGNLKKQLQDQLKKKFTKISISPKIQHFIHNENYFLPSAKKNSSSSSILKDDSVRLGLWPSIKINQAIRSDIHPQIKDFTQLIGEMTDNKSDEISVCPPAPRLSPMPSAKMPPMSDFQTANSSQVYIEK